MNSQKSTPDIQELVEKICIQGCTITRQYIENLINFEKDNTQSLPTLLNETNHAQQKEILDELINIMAVYDNKDCDEN